MTDLSVGPLPVEEARIQSAADEAYRVLEGEGPGPASATGQLLDILRADA